VYEPKIQSHEHVLFWALTCFEVTETHCPSANKIKIFKKLPHDRINGALKGSFIGIIRKQVFKGSVFRHQKAAQNHCR